MAEKTLVHDIKSRLSLSSVIKSVVALRGRADHYVGLCPFHEEKTPSFHVRDREAKFKCFGCGASGDVFEFLMKLRGISFKEAVNELADKAGISWQRKVAPRPLAAATLENELLRAQAAAQEFFVGQLLNTASGQEARDYLLKSRGLSEPMLKQAGVGFSGSSTQVFIAFLRKYGIKEKVALEAGLIRNGNFGVSAQFISRITFPIRSLDGKVIAFGGRSMPTNDQGEPKYVNTHKYLHYEKRKEFYGLFESKNAILKGRPPILVEGYFDAMALWAIGLPALALCGATLTKEHATVLKRLCNKVWVCFDHDEAGFNALKRALTELYQQQIQVNVIELGRKDPGEYLATGLLPELLSLTKKPKNALCYLIDKAALLASTDMETRINQIDELFPIFKHLKRPLLRRQYISYFARALHEDPSLLWADFEKQIRREKKASGQKSPMVGEEKQAQVFSANERLLFEISCAHPALINEIEEMLEQSLPFLRILKALASSLNEPESEFLLSLKNAVCTINPNYWSTVRDTYLNRTAISKEEARVLLTALRAKNEYQRQQDTLKIKRQELKELEKLGDFSLVVRNLKEQSAILKAQKLRTAPNKPGHNPLGEKEESKLDHSISREGKEFDRLSRSTYFEAEEDWL